MDNDMLFCCRLTDKTANQDLTAELLTALDYDFSSWEDLENHLAFHTLYFAAEAEARSAAEKIRALLPEWREFGIIIENVELLSIAREDWAETWKKYFNILHISPRLVIKPGWLDYTPEPGQKIVEIDPGMSFGTGQHATTAYCLKMIDKSVGSGEVKTFLDAGCGSGILSIAAAKLGCEAIAAFDIDPVAVTVAGENIGANGIDPEKIDLQEADVSKYQPPHGTYDLVAANILAHILCANRDKIISFVKPGGKLILAGILSADFADTAGFFSAAGLRQIDGFTEKEWTSGLFERTAET
ncbi:MAG: 50S ribosomal protein L11 methyltransferase [Victivallales bacterium]|nr:50S ribosomal protein L11 methyltransferase [Victivallales bacterium]